MRNLIIGQSGGPTAVINSSLAAVVKTAKKAGVGKVYGMRYGIEGLLQGMVVDMDNYVQDTTDMSLLKRTPSAFLGSCRYKLPEPDGHEDVYKKLFDILEQYDIEYFLYIGGNDSMDTIARLSDYAAYHRRSEKFIGIPKTIDNDLPITDHTPGYGSACKFIATTFKEIICDNESFIGTNPKIAVVEIMGRNAGWLTASSILSKCADCCGPDLIYLPEVDFDMDKFLSDVDNMLGRKRSLVIAVSEGIHTADGTQVCEMTDGYIPYTDAFGHSQLSGASRVLANKIGAETGIKTRSIELSILQRSATHLAARCDIDEAYDVGVVAAQKVTEGYTGKMVSIDVLSREPYVSNYSLVDVHDVANIEKKMPLDWIINDGTYISEDYIDYASPLIIGAVEPYYSRGLPKHLRIEDAE